MLESKSCRALGEDVALVIALSTSHSSGKALKHERSSEATIGELALTLGAHATTVLGPMPVPALGAGGTLALEGPAALRLELGGTYYAPQTVRFDDHPNDGAKLNLLRAGLRLCRLWSLGAVDLGGCVGGQFFRLAGKGFGSAVVSHSGVSILGGPSLGVLARLQLSDRLALLFAADGVVQLARDSFVFGVFGLLHKPSSFALQLFLASEVRL